MWGGIWRTGDVFLIGEGALPKRVVWRAKEEVKRKLRLTRTTSQ